MAETTRVEMSRMLTGVKAPALMLFVGAMLVSVALAQEPGQKTFANPQDASQAMYDAVKSGDKSTLLGILGPSATGVVSSGDEVQDKNNGEFFTKKFEQMSRWAKESDGSMILYCGAENWPFPIPLKKDAAGQWYFDTKSGEREILFRRIGKNELAAVRVIDALVSGQQEYFSQTHDGDTTHQYAQHVLSTEGKQNGLYWKVSEGQTESPVGPLVAYATGEGYGGQHDTPQPFHGYFFRMLDGQGAHAKGGAKSYVVNGKMTGGFAILAYPAEYRNSGVMTFLVDKSGAIREKDLGANTSAMAKDIKVYNPDATWRVVEMPDVESGDDSSNE